MFILEVFSSQAQTLQIKIESTDSSKIKTVDSIGYKKWHQDFNSANLEVTSFITKLERLGYIENKLHSFLKTNDSLFTAKISLNNQYKTVRIFRDPSISFKFLKTDIKNDNNDFVDIDIQNLENVLQGINKELSSKGDPFTVVELTNLERLNNEIIKAHLKIEENTKRNIDSILIKGYEKFPKGFLKHQIKLTANKPFNLDNVKKQTTNFQNINFVNQVREPEVLFTQDSTLLYLYLEKEQVNTFDGFLGFGTNEDTNKIQFDGYLNLNLINNLNYGESLRLFYKSDENEQRTFDVNVNMPFLFKTPIGVTANLNIFRRDSTFQNAEQSFKVDYQINLKNRVSLGISGLNSTNLSGATNLFIQDFKSTFYLAQFNHITPQFYDLLFPVNFYFDLSAGFGNRISGDTSINQALVKINTYKIFNLNNRNSVYVRIDGASLFSDNFFENELFRFGGINSIRGFEENTLLANLYGVINTEYRYKLSSNLFVHTVIDAAYSENEITEINNKLLGFGFGFGLLTNTGLFRFNYSSAKTEGQPFRLSDSKVHISLTTQF
jgi:outer membrane protein assembly factor BamA